ncbi:NAD-dependent epimerase/dehydratase family protein [Weissella cibaria]|uniref:NAD-dependent epimerase/dehydratase family protein n=1 Tax=Weissella cibaria TaxID=137591 RepID=UPI0007056E69|nr:NAD-dependent epimerase/dehydratase family protein [Weissella cibaria]ALI33785.1 nucleoside-diphosphate sugar epimerase [Weissella cibaria]WCE25660.1 NAD-dependent epimerase/dehydratase family protein [Weissella cibaria]WCE27848.1 NAD-dependent epimerase/dehydratase family protein [Weissella cibaria]HCU08900.1 nucleoside-diphosphate sugar epimerase [Weissella cibaria]
MKIKIVIAGGTGFVGQGIIKQLSPETFEVHSLSRHHYEPTETDHTIYHAVDLSQLQEWKHIVEDADWVIDAVGILIPNPIKGINYKNSSYEPAKYLIDQIVNQTNTKFLFVSANNGPFFMKPYMNAKRAVELHMKQDIPNRSYIVYPGIIFDKSRISSFVPGLIMSHMTKLPYFRKLRPVSLKEFSTEIELILTGHYSVLEQQI